MCHKSNTIWFQLCTTEDLVVWSPHELLFGLFVVRLLPVWLLVTSLAG